MEPAISPILVPIIHQTAGNAGTLWGTHSRKHDLTSAKMEAAVHDLQDYYSCASATSIAVLAKEKGR